MKLRLTLDDGKEVEVWRNIREDGFDGGHEPAFYSNPELLDFLTGCLRKCEKLIPKKPPFLETPKGEAAIVLMRTHVALHKALDFLGVDPSEYDLKELGHYMPIDAVFDLMGVPQDDEQISILEDSNYGKFRLQNGTVSEQPNSLLRDRYSNLAFDLSEEDDIYEFLRKLRRDTEALKA